jgi:pellino
MVDQINAGRPQCPVGLNTLVIPRNKIYLGVGSTQPYVYLNCGHVQGHHDWDKGSGGVRKCPLCTTVSENFSYAPVYTFLCKS